MELNDREKHIASLITQLSEYANDESTTQVAIDKILGEIQRETKENAKEEMAKVKSEAQELDNAFRRQEPISNGFDERIIMNKEDYSMRMPQQNSIIFTRIREVKKPGKAHPTDAGIDFYVPDEKAWNEDFKKKVVEMSRNPECSQEKEFVEFVPEDETIGGEHIPPYIVVRPGGHVAIPSGIKTIIPQGFGMMMVNKSGVATKMKLDHSACLIDSEYRDELVFCFFNHNTEPIQIEPGMKITQGLIVPIINFPLDEVVNRTYEDMGKDTNRGGGFGSSGNT